MEALPKEFLQALTGKNIKNLRIMQKMSRNAKRAWEDELITSSKAAGYLDISTNEFLDMMRG